jgi:hypothetical protein
MSTQPTSAAPPGWYPDPALPSRQLRYYDGQAWTSYLAPLTAPAHPSTFGASPSDPTHWLLPTGRSWQSITAGYVALFALLLWPLGPVAFGLGAWAMIVADRTGTHGRGRAVFAMVVGVLSTLALVWFVASR